MNEIPMIIWVGIALAAIHMALCHILLQRVKHEDAMAFAKMGGFHLLLNNTPDSTLRLWKWLCSAEPNNFSVSIRILVWLIRLLTVGFVGWFLFVAISIFLH